MNTNFISDNFNQLAGATFFCDESPCLAWSVGDSAKQNQSPPPHPPPPLPHDDPHELPQLLLPLSELLQSPRSGFVNGAKADTITFYSVQFFQ